MMGRGDSFVQSGDVSGFRGIRVYDSQSVNLEGIVGVLLGFVGGFAGSAPKIRPFLRALNGRVGIWI